MVEDDQTNFGRMVVWKWLSLKRFFPEEKKILPEPPLRGCISVSQLVWYCQSKVVDEMQDYRESGASIQVNFP